MNNPEDFPVDIDAERAWLHQHREDANLSWQQVADRSGIPFGTLSPWATGTYNGRSDNVARRVYRYRQMVESQAKRAETATAAVTGKAMGLVDMPTVRRLNALMVTAQSGEITVAATGPGTGKTMAARDYAACVSNVWIATFDPTTKSLAAMVRVVLKAVGGKTGHGWLGQMSAQVMELVANRNGLLICDEANHLDFQAIEQIRAWHDLTGVGICLLGNEELIATIRGGNQRHTSHAFARLKSRIAMSHVQDLPLEADIDAYLDAWGIENGETRGFLRRVGRTPGAGGLREIRQIVSIASTLAADDGASLSYPHVREAAALRSTQMLREAS